MSERSSDSGDSTRRGDGEVLHGGAERVPVKWVNAEAPLTLSLYGVAPGGMVSMHVHTGKTEHWLIAIGAGQVTVGGDTFDVAPGDIVSTPPGLPHKLVNHSQERLVFVNFVEVEEGARVSTRELDA